MHQTLAFHSYKGGTGKTTIAANLAVVYAQRGKRVCILDFDFRAPSLHFLFGIKPKRGTWLNDFLNGKRSISKVLHQADIGKKGKLAVGCSNPSADAMWGMARKGREEWGGIFRRSLDAKRAILKDLGYDYIILDTSPGVHDSSMSALALCDVVILTLKRDELDVEGTKELVVGFHKKLGRRTAMLLNRVLFHPYAGVSSEEEKDLSERVQKKFEFPVLGVIPCFCDLLIDGSEVIYSLEKPEHTFVERLLAISEKIEKL